MGTLAVIVLGRMEGLVGDCRGGLLALTAWAGRVMLRTTKATPSAVSLVTPVCKCRAPSCHTCVTQVNPYEPYLDYYSGDVDPTPLLNAPEPKRRFIPSKWEEQK